MPFTLLTRSEESDEPLWLVDESILFEQKLVYLWSGEQIREDREGRGTLWITNQSVESTQRVA